MDLISELYDVDDTTTSQVYSPALDKFSEWSVRSLSCWPTTILLSFLHVYVLMLIVTLQVSV